jgi:hypothetical protein
MTSCVSPLNAARKSLAWSIEPGFPMTLFPKATTVSAPRIQRPGRMAATAFALRRAFSRARSAGDKWDEVTPSSSRTRAVTTSKRTPIPRSNSRRRGDSLARMICSLDMDDCLAGPADGGKERKEHKK